MKRKHKIILSLIFAAGVGMALYGVTYQRTPQSALPRDRSGALAARNSSPSQTSGAPPVAGNQANGQLVRGRDTARFPITSDGTDLTGKLKDGRYRGDRFSAIYGYLQLVATVDQGRVTDVSVTEFPRHTGTSRYINGVAIPYLVQEAVTLQSSRLHLISGATLTSRAFIMSYDSALQQALLPQYQTSTS